LMASLANKLVKSFVCVFCIWSFKPKMPNQR
jgi:hypothetical protein